MLRCWESLKGTCRSLDQEISMTIEVELSLSVLALWKSNEGLIPHLADYPPSSIDNPLIALSLEVCDRRSAL